MTYLLWKQEEYQFYKPLHIHEKDIGIWTQCEPVATLEERVEIVNTMIAQVLYNIYHNYDR